MSGMSHKVTHTRVGTVYITVKNVTKPLVIHVNKKATVNIVEDQFTHKINIKVGY